MKSGFKTLIVMFVVAFNISLLLATETKNILLTQTEVTDSSTAKELRELINSYKLKVTRTANNVKSSIDKLANEVKIMNTKVISAQRKAKEVEGKMKRISLEEQDIKVLLERARSFSIHKRDKQKWNNIYLPDGAKIYQNVNDAFKSGAVKKIGNPYGWSNYHLTKKWDNEYMIRIGFNNNNYKNGIEIKVPETYEVFWIRCSNHVWGRFRISREDNGKRIQLGVFTCGHRNLQLLSPDGGSADSAYLTHAWTPIPVGTSGTYYMESELYCNGWISGFAFSKNPWGHAYNSSVAYHWGVNGGSHIGWYSNNWNNDAVAIINKGVVSTLKVPVVSNGKDKLLYLMEHNSGWNGIQHSEITVNGKKIERFRSTYLNPFTTHFNSKNYSRYFAAFVPKELIKDLEPFLTVQIDMRNQDNGIYFMEMGTHDFN